MNLNREIHCRLCLQMLTEKKKKKKKRYICINLFFLDLADMYNYIKMVLAHLMVVFHFNRSRRVTEKGRCRPRVQPGTGDQEGLAASAGLRQKGVLLAAPRGEGSKIKEGRYFIFAIFNQKTFITSGAWIT